MADEAVVATSKRSLLPLVLSGLALVVAIWASFRFDLRWAGAGIVIALLGVVTWLSFRAGERAAIDAGRFSPALHRYNRRMLTAAALYVAGLMIAVWIHDTLHPPTLVAFLTALLPSLGVLAMIWALARLVTEETDEYLRHRSIIAALVGLGGLLALATLWGFFEQFDLVPHVPTWAAVPVFGVGFGLGNCLPARRA